MNILQEIAEHEINQIKCRLQDAENVAEDILKRGHELTPAELAAASAALVEAMKLQAAGKALSDFSDNYLEDADVIIAASKCASADQTHNVLPSLK